jgi:hypothetical protein
VPTRRRSSRASRVAESAVAVSEPPRSAAEAAGSRQEVAVVVAATVAVSATPAVPPESVPSAVDQAVVLEIPDDDAPPPGWGQWENWPAPAPEPAAGVLVVREDGCVVPRRPTHGVEASSSRAGLPAPNTAVMHLEQGREPAGAPPTYFNEAQAEQALWQELRDHRASLNNTLNESLRIHAGPTWQILKVRALVVEFEIFPSAFAPMRSRILPSLASRSPLTGA